MANEKISRVSLDCDRVMDVHVRKIEVELNGGQHEMLTLLADKEIGCRGMIGGGDSGFVHTIKAVCVGIQFFIE